MKNKISLLLFVVMLASFSVHAQTGSWADKISWSFKVVKLDESHAEIVATATLAEHWHVYSMDHDPMKADFTGVPTTMELKSNSNFRAIGKARDGVSPDEYTDELGTSLIFEGKAVFKQKMEVLSDKPFDIEVEYRFQVCDEQGCLFPPAQFATVKVKGFKPKSEEEVEDELSINGDEATDKEGNQFVQFNNRWVKVPEGNSVKFFKEYLKLGGSYE